VAAHVRPTERPTERLSLVGSRISGKPRDAADLADATARWNAESGPLTKLRRPPTDTRARKLLDAYRQADSPEHFSAAVRLAGLDEWYRDHHYDVETFCNRAGRWLDAAAPAPPPAIVPEEPWEREQREREEAWETFRREHPEEAAVQEAAAQARRRALSAQMNRLKASA
jgi:hypothetical protein